MSNNSPEPADAGGPAGEKPARTSSLPSWLPTGDKDMDEAAGLHFAALEIGNPHYYSERDGEANDGTYKLVEDFRLSDEDKAVVKGAALDQMPLEAGALVHAVKAVTRMQDNRRARFILERCLEGALDAVGTFLALTDSKARSSDAAEASQSIGETDE